MIEDSANNHDRQKFMASVRPYRGDYRIGLLLVCCLLLAGGCASLSELSQPDLGIEYYSIDIEPPAATAETIPGVLRFRQFTTGPLYNTKAIIYRTREFQTDEYVYHRWHAAPADMTADSLYRAIRESGLFQVVFGPESLNPADYCLDGHLETFLENDTVSPWQAELALVVTLIDPSANEPRQQILMQKRYTATEPCLRDNPRALAEAMSRALGTVAAEIIVDITDRLAEVENQSGTDLSPE
ncbi:MAG: ABC-type transport auxiliary lipoprotein family protein [Desulfosudaceae bacterium]